MDTPNFRHQLYLQGKKVIPLFFAAAFLFISTARGQNLRENYLPNYDQKWIRYGFTLGGHVSSFRLNYNEVFTSPLMDSVHSIVPPNSFGFSIGFIVNFRLAQYLDFRVLPKVSFYDNKLEYNFTDDSPQQQRFVDATIVELPLLFKYKSQRRRNNRMYLVGGVTPSIDATGKKDDENSDSRLTVKNGNLSADIGFGVDIYYPLFKFSPEIRFSKGLINILRPDSNPSTQGIDRLTTNSVSIYLQFE